MTKHHRAGWTFAVVSLGLFMITLDNLVVTTALPSIRRDLGASLGSLEWMVNAYTLSFALLLRFFRSRSFSATNLVSFSMYFGVFGSIFFFAQFFQTAQGYGPFEAGLRTLPWTGMPMLVAPIAGLLSDRIGSRPLMTAGLA